MAEDSIEAGMLATATVSERAGKAAEPGGQEVTEQLEINSPAAEVAQTANGTLLGDSSKILAVKRAQLDQTSETIRSYHKSEAFTVDLAQAFAQACRQAQRENAELGLVLPLPTPRRPAGAFRAEHD